MDLELGLRLGFLAASIKRAIFTADAATTTGTFAPVTLKGDFRIRFKAVRSSKLTGSDRVLLAGSAVGGPAVLFSNTGQLNYRHTIGGGTDYHNFGTSFDSDLLLEFDFTRVGVDLRCAINGVDTGNVVTILGDQTFDTTFQNGDGTLYFDSNVMDLEIIDLDQPASRDVLTFDGLATKATIPTWTATGDFEIDVPFASSNTTASTFVWSGGIGATGLELYLTSPGKLQGYYANAPIAGLSTPLSYNDGEAHVATVRRVAGQIYIAVDGTDVVGPVALAGTVTVDTVGHRPGEGFYFSGQSLGIKLHDLTTPSNSRRYRFDKYHEHVADDYAGEGAEITGNPDFTGTTYGLANLIDVGNTDVIPFGWDRYNAVNLASLFTDPATGITSIEVDAGNNSDGAGKGRSGLAHHLLIAGKTYRVTGKVKKLTEDTSEFWFYQGDGWVTENQGKNSRVWDTVPAGEYELDFTMAVATSDWFIAAARFAPTGSRWEIHELNVREIYNPAALSNALSTDWETMTRDVATGELVGPEAWTGTDILTGAVSVLTTGVYAFAVTGGGGAEIKQNNAEITLGEVYRISFTITDYVDGDLAVTVGGWQTLSVTGNGEYVFTANPATTVTAQLSRSGAECHYTLSNISFEQVIADPNYVAPANICWKLNQGRFGAGAYETDAQSVTGPELVPGGDFETGVAGWVATGAALAVDADAFEGSQSMRITALDGASDRGEFTVSGLTVGADYVASFAVKNDSTAANARASGWTVGTVASIEFDPSTEWVEHALTFTATATSGLVRLYAANVGSIGDYILIDKLSIKAAPHTLALANVVETDWEYFLKKSWRWVSQLGNLVQNPKFDTDTVWSKDAGWTISGGQAHVDGTQLGNADITQTVPSITLGYIYDASYMADNYVAGEHRVRIGGTSGVQHTVHEGGETLVAGNSQLVKLRADVNAVLSLDELVVNRIIPFKARPTALTILWGDGWGWDG